MIDIRKLKELVRLMVANDLSEIDLRDSEEQVTIHEANGLIGATGHPDACRRSATTIGRPRAASRGGCPGPGRGSTRTPS